MTKHRAPTVSVTDHAIVRWLERVEGLDVATLREQIARSAAVGLAFGSRIVVVSGGKLILEGETVVTVLRPAHTRREHLGEIEVSIAGEIASRRRPKGRRR